MSNVEYRNGRFFEDGRPLFVIASDYQYYRDRRDNWLDRLTKLKQAGVNVITFYTPWRHHLRFENGRREYDFVGKTKDNRDLVGFLKLVNSLELYMIAKPGPFVHSELNVGGMPDLVCPSMNPGMPAVRRHHGGPAFWSYDASILPAPFAPEFDDLAREWLEAVGRIITPYTQDRGRIIAIQLNDETIYCTSNDPPWHIGYEPSGMRFYHELLKQRYGDIANYNRLHGTALEAYEFAPAPKLAAAEPSHPAPPPGRQSREQLLQTIDWAEYQWRLRRDLYVRYKDYLGIDHLPYLTNYAGITPPIEENIPDFQEESAERVPQEYARLYPEWWFATNRIDQDADVYHYGMISWLGVAAYDRDVFDRYINTARRARGINMEENWGFGMLYDTKSRHPIIPFFQTLVSLAGGATGYDIYIGAGTDYWDDSLDRITKLQCPSFPSHAPIDEEGNCRPMYYTAKMLNEWFVRHGEKLLECEPEADCAYLLYAPYAAVSSWVPDEGYWRLSGHEIPRCGYQGFEEFSRSLQEAGYLPEMFELEAATPERLQSCRAVALHSAFFMDEKAQELLAEFIESGGKLFISGELPVVDLSWRDCTRLKDAVEANRNGDSAHFRRENFFADGNFAARLAQSGIMPAVRYADNMRAYIHRSGEDFFVFFFNFDVEGSHDKWIEFYGQRLEMRLGSKTSGVLHIGEGRLLGYVVKGLNEVEGIESEVRIQLGDQVVANRGDFSSCE